MSVAEVAWEDEGEGPVQVDRSGTPRAGAARIQKEELFRLVEAETSRGIA